MTVFLGDNQMEEGVVRWIGELEINPGRCTYGMEFVSLFIIFIYQLLI